MARSSQSGSGYAKFWATGVKCCCGFTADGHFGNVPNLWCCHPCYLCPCQRVGVPQLLDAALQQLRCLPEAGCEGMQLLWGTHTAGQWGQPAHEEKEKEEQCQDRAWNTVRHCVKADEEGSVVVDGQLQAGAGRKELDPPVLRALLFIPFSQAFLSLFQGCVWDI